MSISKQVTLSLFRKYRYGERSEMNTECAYTFGQHYLDLLIKSNPEMLYGDYRGLSDEEYHAMNEVQQFLAIC